MINVQHIGHLMLTVASIDRACQFYREKLGMEVLGSGSSKTLVFGKYKIYLHQLGGDLHPKPRNTLPGAISICFITQTPITVFRAFLIANKVPQVSPVLFKAEHGKKKEWIYLRDPDGNLLEIANYQLE